MADRYADRYQGAPSRVDDDGYGQETRSGDNDPLAELARLIGQTDPFARLTHEPAPPLPGTPADEPYEAAPALPAWMKRVNQREPSPPVYDDNAYAEPEAEPTYEDEAPYVDSQPALPNFMQPGRRADAGEGQYPGDQDPARYDEALYGTPPSPFAPYGAQSADPYADPYADQPEYDQQAARAVVRPRGGMAIVVAVLALAFVGTAGAYAYRTLVGAPHTGEAPIIKADPGPNKIVPPTQSADAGKQIQDRISTGSGSERVVSREEQPVDVNAPRSGGPRVVFPPLTTNPNPAAAPVAAPNRLPAGGPPVANPGGDEPRKVRTVAIRPDQPESVPQTAAPTPKPVAAQRVVAPSAAAPSQAAPAANAPISLTPQATAPAAPARVATVTPTQTPPVASGGYMVQIASQRSEADAQASYRALQGKYPSVLGSRTPLIKRADLGDKGVYYRAMIGPFGSPDEASQFCGSLKSAGGQCVVQRN
jgi:hypothetical protein